MPDQHTTPNSLTEVHPERICTFPVKCTSNTACPECAELREIDEPLEAPNLSERTCGVLSRINARRDVLTTRLPMEVVCRIFEEYIILQSLPRFKPIPRAVLESAPVHFTTSSPEAPLSLGKVCRQWRSIAWSHPPLWNTLHINLSSVGYKHGPEIVKEWLARAGDLPLDVRIDDGPNYDLTNASVDPPADEIFKTIKAFSSRWRSLDIRILELIVIRAFVPSFSDSQGTESPSLLRNLSLVGQGFDESIPADRLIDSGQWTQLTHLHVGDFYVDILWEMMENLSQGTSHLIQLSLSDLCGSARALPASVIRLPRLLSLSVQRSSSERITGALLDRLDTPALESLAMEPLSAISIQNLNSFIARSCCSPRKLILSRLRDVSTESLRMMLSAVPAVEDIMIGSHFVMDAFPILPKLRRLNFYANALINWPSVLGMYVDNPYITFEGRRETSLPQVPRPSRESLVTTKMIQNRHHGENPVDINSILVFVHLWKQYGILCWPEQLEENLLGPNLLLSSYQDWAESGGVELDGTILDVISEMEVAADIGF